MIAAVIRVSMSVAELGMIAGSAFALGLFAGLWIRR